MKGETEVIRPIEQLLDDLLMEVREDGEDKHRTREEL